jgi:LuxR family transcriptional regulator, maltose regulon positive regulatory protein
MQDNATQSITLSKLHRPRLSGRPVQRARLLEQLSTSASLMLVIAPAGYGKTTLLATWLETCALPSAWLSLDEHDDDLVVFGTYLAAAVRTLFPAACQDTLDLLHGITTPPVDVINRTLSNDLSVLQHEFILVLEDYHRIHDHAIHQLMTDLTRHLPQPLHLVLAARTDPALPLSGLRARGHVIELREADLRFSQEETASFLREDMRLEVDDQVVADLQHYTEGWGAGLRLAALYLRQTGDLAGLAADRLGSNRYIMSYLVAEVLAHVPDAVQEFLLKTSILDRFCAPLCRAVTGMDDAACGAESCLAWLERNSLFVRSVDEDRRWFQYHQLFQRLLIDQLEQRHGKAAMGALHLKASAWFAQHGYPEDALRHALAGGDTAAAVRLVAQYRCRVTNGEQWQRLERWLRLFPRALIEGEPELLLAEAWLMRIHYHIGEMVVLLDRAEEVIQRLAPEPAPAGRLEGEIAGLRAVQYYFGGDVPASFAAAQTALEKIPWEWWYLRAHAHLLLSAGYQMKGELAQAYDTLYDSGEPDQSRAFHMRLILHACLIHSVAGDLSGMAQAAMQVLEGSDAAGSQDSQGETIAWARYHLGIFHYERNNLVQAESYLAPIVAQPYQGHLLCSLNAAVALALICQAQGQPDKARKIADMMVSLALETGSAGALALAKGFQAELAARQGRLAEAIQWAEQFAGPLATPKPFFYYRSLTLVRILIAQDTPASRQQAGDILSTLYDYFASIHHTSVQIDVLALQALLNQLEGNESAALTPLAQALTRAEPGGYVRPFLDLGEPLERLLTVLVRKQPAVPYATRILAAFPKRPSPSAAREHGDDVLLSPLTPREFEVLALLEKHYTDRQIAETLVVSLPTVRSHIDHLGEKLGASGRRAIVEVAKAHGLL